MSLPQLGEKLPSLATTCLLIGHAKRADIVWTRPQFMSLCEHLLNGNPRNDFLLAFPRSAGDMREPYAKSKGQRMEKRAAWAWDCITKRAKNPCGIGFYPSNRDHKSRWAAMDFDSHDGGLDRARKLALAAFEVLLPHKDLFIVLSTSGGGGWHLFALTADFYPVEEWARLLRQVADFIGAPVTKGICEIFPNDSRGLGNAIRCPGTWHPKSNDCGLIAFERIQPLLQTSTRGEERDSPFLNQSTARGKGSLSLQSRGDNRCETALRKRAIVETSTRHEQLAALVAELYRFYSRSIIETLARRQFEAKTVSTQADLDAHLTDFDAIWDYWMARYRGALTAAEKGRESILRTDEEREAFRLAWGFANIEPAKDFAYSTEHFAWNLGLTIPGVCKQRDKFCSLAIIALTAPCVPNQSAARFRWIAGKAQL